MVLSLYLLCVVQPNNLDLIIIWLLCDIHAAGL